MTASSPVRTVPTRASFPAEDGKKRVPVIDESECVGCNRCEIGCAVPGCMTIEKVDNGFAPATWNEHVNESKPLRPKNGAH